MVLNPQIRMRRRQLRAVLVNEAVRLLLARRPDACPTFFLTLEQQWRFRAYGGGSADRSRTVMARLVARDPSAGRPSTAQRRLARLIAARLGLVEKGGAWSHILAGVVRR